jgi:hypothetical protein
LFYVGVAATGTLIFAGSGLYRAVVRFIGGRVLFSILPASRARPSCSGS